MIDKLVEEIAKAAKTSFFSEQNSLATFFAMNETRKINIETPIKSKLYELALDNGTKGANGLLWANDR